MPEKEIKIYCSESVFKCKYLDLVYLKCKLRNIRLIYNEHGKIIAKYKYNTCNSCEHEDGTIIQIKNGLKNIIYPDGEERWYDADDRLHRGNNLPAKITYFEENYYRVYRYEYYYHGIYTKSESEEKLLTLKNEVVLKDEINKKIDDLDYLSKEDKETVKKLAVEKSKKLLLEKEQLKSKIIELEEKLSSLKKEKKIILTFKRNIEID